MPPERDLFANFERMRREIDELFGDVFDRSGFGPTRAFTPEVDVYYDVDEVALEIRGRQLIIAGERRAQEAAGRLYQQIEIAHGPFRRVVELGADVEADQASATYEDGILRIEIPLVQQADETRRIPIEPKPEELGEGG
jgi:HSP20 family protein